MSKSYQRKYAKYKLKYLKTKQTGGQTDGQIGGQAGGDPPIMGKSLYDRLGGVFPIALVINEFSDRLITNPVVGQTSANPYLSDWHKNKLDRLPGLKFMRSLWLCAVSGGPFKFSPTVPEKCPFSLENAHAKFRISPAEFDAVAKVLSETLDYYHIPEKEKGEVLNAFAAHKGEINLGYYEATGQTPLPIIC